ncbi:MAG: hypothetical protein K2P84_08770 [Undibacterium sp.]|nr:hypothetical protein [Undibacterium sp.]
MFPIGKCFVALGLVCLVFISQAHAQIGTIETRHFLGADAQVQRPV